MGIWSDVPRLASVPDTNDVGELKAYIKVLANTVAKMAKDLEFLVNGNLDANNIRAESIETKNLKAKAVVAEKIDVSQLSAISADLGTINAGEINSVEIYGSKISTNKSSYPKVEISNTQNMIGAYINSYNGVEIFASNNTYLSPVIRFGGVSNPSYIFYDSVDNVITMTSNSANINISTSGSIELFSDQIKIHRWDQIIKNGTNETLLDALINAGYTPPI